jgi:hypothetical protein
MSDILITHDEDIPRQIPYGPRRVLSGVEIRDIDLEQVLDTAGVVMGAILVQAVQVARPT